MNRLVRSARDCRVPFNSDGIRPNIGCDASRCLTIQASETNNFPGSDHGRKQNEYIGRKFDRTRICQKRGYHQLFGNSSSPGLQRQQQLYIQLLQVRRLVFDSRKAKKAKKQKDPFKVLKVPKESLYKDVKVKFLKIAMANHPDMQPEGISEKEQEAMRDKFIEARMAFERLEEDPEDGTAILVEELIDRESNFDSWFKNETGLKNPFDVNIDPETMKEVAEMTEKLGGMEGMARDGGMWGKTEWRDQFRSLDFCFFVHALARMVTSAVKSGGDAQSILRLESGDVKGKTPAGPNGALRRPRRR